MGGGTHVDSTGQVKVRENSSKDGWCRERLHPAICCKFRIHFQGKGLPSGLIYVLLLIHPGEAAQLR